MQLSNLIVFHRGLGSSDESATDEEQGEKILYYYPEDTALYDQLSRMNLLEGLVDFTSRFSSEPLDVVVMKNMTYAFLFCELDLWIVIGMNNIELESKESAPSSSSTSESTQSHDFSSAPNSPAPSASSSTSPSISGPAERRPRRHRALERPQGPEPARRHARDDARPALITPRRAGGGAGR
jgi:hypothetical protein